MGFYINPRDVSKEHWLNSNGLPIHPEEAKAVLDTGVLYPVCLVHNGAFTAAGICYSQAELIAFTLPDDNRPKLWFMVSKELLVDAGFIPASAFEE